MWPLLVVLGQPGVQFGLQFFHCSIQFLAERDVVELVFDGPMEAFTDAVRLAHPERLRMLGLLRIEGPATATGLADRLGLNFGATSYHLRQLAKHGFIAEADDLGTKRERWWRAKHDTTSFDVSDQSGDPGHCHQTVANRIVLGKLAYLLLKGSQLLPQRCPGG